MDILHRVIRRIHSQPLDPAAHTLRALIKSIDAGEQFDINQLYELNYSDFGMAMELMKQWRLDQFKYERGWASRASAEPGVPMRAPAWLESIGATLDLRR